MAVPIELRNALFTSVMLNRPCSSRLIEFKVGQYRYKTVDFMVGTSTINSTFKSFTYSFIQLLLHSYPFVHSHSFIHPFMHTDRHTDIHTYFDTYRRCDRHMYIHARIHTLHYTAFHSMTVHYSTFIYTHSVISVSIAIRCITLRLVSFNHSLQIES